MTKQQRAELEKLNAKIEAAPAEIRPNLVAERAQLLSKTDCDLREIAPDCGAWIREYYQREEWKNLPAWKVRAQLLHNAQSYWNAAMAQRSIESARLSKASAMAGFAYIVDISPELRDKLDFDALDILESAHNSDEARAPEENASLEEMQIWTLARHIARGVEAAARAYERVLRRQIAAGRTSSAISSHVHRARRLQSEPYQQLAWWNLVIAGAPDEPKW